MITVARSFLSEIQFQSRFFDCTIQQFVSKDFEQKNPE